MKQSVQDILDTPLSEDQGVMAIMIPYDDPTHEPGDIKVTWDRGDVDGINTARETFKHWKAKGYMAYMVTDGGRKGQVIDAFDPTAKQIILALPQQGGR